MKQFLHASPRRAFALVAALAVFALPARADTLMLSYDDDWPCTMTVGDDPLEFTAIRGDTTGSKTVRASSSNSAVVEVKPASVTAAAGVDLVTFTLVAKKASTTTVTITVAIAGDAASQATFPVTVNAAPGETSVSFTDVNNNPIGGFAALGEGETRTVLYKPSTVPFDVTPSSADWADHVQYTADGGVVTITGLDGTYSFGLAFSDPDGIYDATSLNVLVTNKPPKISGSPDSKEPTILGGRRLKNQVYAFPASMFTPSDVAADMEKLVFTWSLSPASIDINGAFSNSWSSATEEGEYELFSVTVSDGNDSYTGYYALQIKDTVPLFTDTTAPWAGLEKQGGIAQDTTFTAMDSAGNPIAWSLLGGRIGRALVGPNESVTLTAILEDGTYPFAWFGDKEQYLRAPNATRTPSPNLWAIVTMPEEGDVTINYYASYPYYHTEPGKGAVNGLNPVLTDLFGDFDADGLSDTWEDYYFPVDVPKTSDNVESLPVGIPNGDYGPVGNRDDDWLPTSLYQPAPDGARKIGWPAEDPDNPGTTNRYRVYKYPLDFSTGGESYNKSAYDEKPLFGNFIEYRGLAEDRTQGDGEDPKVFVYYAPEFVFNDLERGNCSGTDPENYDTDGDGFSDGWEFYFWTTIKYRVNTQNWRAWDPTYSLYSTASATAGIPLLKTDEEVNFAFLISPTRSYDIDPAANTYQTTYEVDKDVVKANKLIMPVTPGSVRIVFDNDEAFELWTIQGRMTTDGKDALFYQKWADTDGDNIVDTPAVDEEGNPVVAQLNGAWVEGATGYMHVPGWTVLTALADTGATAGIVQDTAATVSYVRLNGIFSQRHLLSRFDPMNWTETDMGSVADVVKSLGLDEKKWDPDSDLDGDGVLDIEEYYLGTDPLHWDTDRDGMPDGWEVQRGLLPRDPRNGVNGCGPGDNPDEDYMAVTRGSLGMPYPGTWSHIYAYLADLYNRKYWNGLSYVGFVPGMAATTGTPYSNREEFLLSLYGFQTGFWWDEWRLPLGYEERYTRNMVSIYAKGIYPIDWPDTTSNPCDNDTNRNGIPDGWELYVGYNPIDGVCVTPLSFPPEDDPDIDNLNLFQEFACVEAAERWPEDRTVYIGADASITENTSTTVDADGNTNTVYSTTGEGTEVTIRAMKLAYAAWSNKKLPTDPWNSDTDGDGLTDYQEYTDEMDGNGDGIELTNFNPGSADTDRDWLPDGWEFLMGTYTTNQTPGVSTTDPYGPYGDPDGDGLPNYQEYLTGANYGWRHDKWYSLDNQKIWIPQKRSEYIDPDDKYDILQGDWPYDPGLYPEYGPVVKAHQYQPMDFFAVPESPAWINEGILALRTIEKRWGVTAAESPSIQYETVAAFFQRLTEIVLNPFDDPSGMGLPKFMFDTQPSVDPDYNTDGQDIPGKKYFLYHSPEEHWAIVHAYEGMLYHLYSYAQCGYSWDPVFKNTPSEVVWTYIPLNDNSTGSGFPGTRPKELDSDHDNMPDYWEIYHGLNPIYGGCIAISDKAGSEADTDWDGADNWMMGNDPNFVLNLHVLPPLEPVCRFDHVWYDEMGITHTFGDGESTAFGGVLERAHYDLVRRPWLAGDPSADCDHDGINNSEESYSVFANDLLHNTDPSPYWLTDITQTYEAFGQKASYVNLYYTSLGFGDDPADYWWWEYPYTGNKGCNGPPTYLWDFEINEGYDSDNNNISDREELTDVSTRGKTDPQDLDSPVSRKAMYFDGYAACRTQRPFFHDQYALTSFTVELWVRPQELPAPGKIATLLQRPVMMPVDTVSGSKAWDIRHTFLVYLNEKGEVCAEVDNDGIEQPANKAVVSSAGRLVPNVWTHVALVMDSQGDHLTLYLNGEQAGQIATSLKPCTGVIMDTSYQNWVTSEGGENGVQISSTTTVNFQYSPAPIVLGAFDTTPWSVIGLNPDATFDENRFFRGWIDEVRIWDRARTQSEIFNNMTKRFTKADFAEINQTRFRWDMENLYQTNSEDTFPQKLLYLYNFDNLPDVAPATTRIDDLVFASDTDPVPAGWPQIAATRAIPYVPWWYVTKNRSTVYSTDYSYVPFIENVVSHMPQRPPRGIKELVPVFDAEWNLAGYRYRLSADWTEELEADIIAGDQVIGDIEYQYEENGQGETVNDAQISNSALIAPRRLTNTMDPYGDTYSTGVAAMYQVNPWNFAGILDPYGVYEGVPVHSDMVPLLDAVADMDVPMWDGKGAGWDNSAIDSDGDGMPDWWEISFGLDPNSAAGIDGAYGDADNDGLDNWAEYSAWTDPHAYDTDSDGYSDYYSRPNNRSLTYGELYDDGDGMDNAWEIDHGLDPNRHDGNLDYDFDGWTNWEEYMAGTDPTRADIFPTPDLNVLFHYNGENVFDSAGNSAVAFVAAYAEKTAGEEMGGSEDGIYRAFVSESGTFRPTSLALTIGGTKEEFTRIAQLGNVNIGQASFSLLLNGVPATYEVSPYKTDPDYGRVYENKGKNALVLLHYATGTVYARPGADGIESNFTADYAIGGHAFPYTVHGMTRLTGATVHDHMVSGYNRFLGWLELNGDGVWTPGLEPMGLSVPRPTLVSWDNIETTIPLTDELWDFPRIGWAFAIDAITNMVPTEYIVTFDYVSDISKDADQEQVVTNITGRFAFDDFDGDGLDSFQENLAHTDSRNADSASDGRLDYDSQSATGTLTWGELYDDGDRLPANWEASSGTDPDRYDAEDDPDGDGWTNYEEYLAGTRPNSAADYPIPSFGIRFLYNGDFVGMDGIAAAGDGTDDFWSDGAAGSVSSAANPVVTTYSERRKGTYLDGNAAKGIYMGGAPDGVYTMADYYLANGRVFGSSGNRTVGGNTYAATKLPFGNVISATITVRMDNNDPASDVQFSSTDINTEMLQLAFDTDGSSIFVEKEAGYVLATGTYVGKTFSIEYGVDGYTYPMDATMFFRTKGTHAIGGYNRFFGWLDGNGNATFDEGEPAGLSLYNAVLVGQDSASATIPLTDGLFGFPRFSWPASTNANVTSYKVYIWNGAGDLVVNDGAGNEANAGITIEAPRTFIHEGDYIEHGLRGIDLGDLGTADADRFEWTVVANNGLGQEETVASGDFVVALAPNHGPRRTMKTRSPIGGSTVYGSLVEFQWEMDWRTEGVFFTVEKTDGNDAGVKINNLYVPFPVRHGKVTDDDYYYTYIPQLENGRSIVGLPSGTYTYTIKENIRSTAVTKQSISGTFKIDNNDTSRMGAAITGHVHYYGRLGTALIPGKTVVQAYALPTAATTSLGISGTPVAKSAVAQDGSFALHGLAVGKYAVIGWVDSDGDGLFGNGDTQGFGFLGGSADPIQVAGWCPPLAITNNATTLEACDLPDVHVVLRDRDTDGDGKPQAYTGTAAQWKAASLRTFPSLIPTGFDWVTLYLFSTSNVAKASTGTATTEGDQVATRNRIVGSVRAPRLFFHEEDLVHCLQYTWDNENSVWLDRGEVGYGFNLGTTNAIDVSWVVYASDGWTSQGLVGGTFHVDAGAPEDRRTMKARYPTQLTEVHGNVVEFEWEMDWRNAGVLFDLWKVEDDGSETPIVTNRMVAFPVCHGKPASMEGYYYTATPQLAYDQVDAKRSDGKTFISLEDGTYHWTVTERTRVNLEALPNKQTVGGYFKLENEGKYPGLYTASGNIRYYGKVMERNFLAELGTTGVDDGHWNRSNGQVVFTTTVNSADLPEDVNLADCKGALGVLLVRAKADDETANNWYRKEGGSLDNGLNWAEEFFNDSAADGVFHASSTEGENSTVWAGSIDYETGDISLRFKAEPDADLKIVLVEKVFPEEVPLLIQAFKVADAAGTSTSVAGVPAAQLVCHTKGFFEIPNLAGGTYAIRAFLDSNKNGWADEWETQGVAVQTGTVSPNIDPNASPIVVRDNVSGLMIVLHDCDTDNDLLPDAWEYWKTHDEALPISGYDLSEAGGLYWWQEYADGVLDSEPRTPDTDFDGLTDAMEILVTGTDTHLADTDGDGVGDLEEFLAGSDPLDPASKARYAIPALAFDEDGVPYVDIAYPALRPGVVLTYELQRKLALGGDEAWVTVADHDVANTDGAVFYMASDGVNDHLSAAGTARMWPADQAEGVDFTTGFYRVKIYADYGKMVDNGDGTWSYWTWVKTSANGYEFKEAARGEGTLVRDAQGNWRFVDPETEQKSGSLYRDPDGDWKFVK